MGKGQQFEWQVNRKEEEDEEEASPSPPTSD